MIRGTLKNSNINYFTDKLLVMTSMYKIGGVVAVVLLLIACGAATEGKNKELAKKKARYEELKQQQAKVSDELTKLEKEIATMDTSAARTEKPRLVTLTTLQPGTFNHYIDLQGKIDADNIVYVTPRGQGVIRGLYVKQGDNVRKGQLLAKLDDALIRQQIQQAEVQMNLVKTTYERRKSLWDQKIGTEMELIKAKNDVENLQKQIDILKEQQNMSNVYAPIGGVADQVTIKEGEMFSPGTATMSGIRIVNTANLKVTANVPENYQGKVNEGNNIIITLPEDKSKTINAKVTVTGREIDPNNRSFYIEARIPGNKDFRPGQLALVRIQDYAVNNTITIPLSTIQNDEKGKFVMVAAKENGKTIASKKPVVIGQMYGDQLEIKSGLQSGDVLITEGFQGLYDGQLITTDTK
jgi:RND family efflux transporter MFP subunit